MQSNPSKPFLLLAAFALMGMMATRPAAAQEYTVTDLGTLGGGSMAVGINNHGQVSGRSDDPEHGFLWQNGVMTDIGTLGGGSCRPLRINDAGQIVGSSPTSPGGEWHAFLYSGGTIFDLGVGHGGANGINASGQVAGSSDVSNGDSHAFLWTPTVPNGTSGTAQDLGTLGGTWSTALGVNASGQVTGFSQTPSGATHAFLWQNGVMTDLGTLGGDYSVAFDINDAGQIVGNATTAAGEDHAFLYSGGTMIDLNLSTLGGQSRAWGVNASGQVVGDIGDHAFVWDNAHGMLDLNSLIPSDAGWVLKKAFDINDAGQIVGYGLKSSDTTHIRAFLLTPTTPNIILSSLTLSPDTVAGGASSTGTVTLSNAPTIDTTVNLASDNAAATVPATVTVPAGSTSATFTITTSTVTGTQSATISATMGSVTKTASLTIHPPIKALTLNPSTVVGCKNATGKVTLNGAASSDLVISLTNTNPAASVPASVTIPAGKTSKTFVITTTPVTTTQTGTVTASYGGVSKSATLKVRPIGVAKVTLTPNPVVGGNTVNGTVYLECDAAPGDITVTLSSSNPAVANPTVTSLTIPAGSLTGTFTVTTADVSVVRYATIKAKANSITKGKRLTVNP